MSHTLSISHRMFVAAASLESPDAPETTDYLWDEDESAQLEELALPPWSSLPLGNKPPPSFNTGYNGF